jgi:hypothetical protein
VFSLSALKLSELATSLCIPLIGLYLELVMSSLPGLERFRSPIMLSLQRLNQVRPQSRDMLIQTLDGLYLFVAQCLFGLIKPSSKRGHVLTEPGLTLSNLLNHPEAKRLVALSNQADQYPSWPEPRGAVQCGVRPEI